MKNESSARVSFIFSMAVFGTVGILVRYIPFPSGVIAGVRGIIGASFLLILMSIRKDVPSLEKLHGKLLTLIITGVLIAANWICLFEAYHYTTVATATLCYYLQPIFVTIASPFVFGEKISLKKVLCILTALAGITLISLKDIGSGTMIGVGLGIFAAVLYAIVVMMNKSTSDVPAYDKTFVQLLSAGVIMIPYSIFCESFDTTAISVISVTLLLIVGIFHTGFCYSLYFGSIRSLPMQTVAVLGFIDPVVAIILSSIIFRENPGIAGIIGAVLILGAAFVSEADIGIKRRSK